MERERDMAPILGKIKVTSFLIRMSIPTIRRSKSESLLPCLMRERKEENSYSKVRSEERSG